MKVVAVATLVGEKRKEIEPGTEVNIPDAEAKYLLSRGLVALPKKEESKAAPQDPES